MTQDSMRERLARAIFRATFHPDESQDLVNEKWVEWPDDASRAINQADAVLAALAEPTPAMASAAMHRMSEMPDEPYRIGLAQFGCSIWKVMIAEASK